MSERITRLMVMDLSQDEVRRYWNGHGWTTDPTMGVQSLQNGGVDGYYWYLHEAECQVALVMVELSMPKQRVTMHKIQMLDAVWNSKRPRPVICNLGRQHE